MTTKDIIDSLREKKDFPEFRVGDTLKVHVKIKEGEKERVQVFEGVVIKKKGRNKKEASFTVRKVSYGIGVERVFPFESASLDKIEVVKQGKVRRAKLFYLRDLQGRAAQVREKEVMKEKSANKIKAQELRGKVKSKKVTKTTSEPVAANGN